MNNDGGGNPGGQYPSPGGGGGFQGSHGGQPGGGGYAPSTGPAGGGGGYPPAVGPYGDPYGHQPMGGLKAMGSGNYMNDVFFAAACCIIVGSFIGGSALLFHGDFVDWLELTYLFFFGITLALLDTPLMKTIKLVMDAKMYIGKYIQFATRLTGKGICLVFLGSALFMTMWTNLENGFMKFLAVVLCFFPVGVGICAIVLGLLKSTKLDKVRRQLMLVIDQRYDSVAQMYPGPNGGLTMSEFNKLTFENGGGVKFETQDLKLIFNALVSNPSWRQQVGGGSTQGGYQSVNSGEDLKIPKNDLLAWCRDGMVLL